MTPFGDIRSPFDLSPGDSVARSTLILLLLLKKKEIMLYGVGGLLLLSTVPISKSLSSYFWKSCYCRANFSSVSRMSGPSELNELSNLLELLELLLLESLTSG